MKKSTHADMGIPGKIYKLGAHRSVATFPRPLTGGGDLERAFGAFLAPDVSEIEPRRARGLRWFAVELTTCD
jgi:hypothetical protein